MVDLFENWFVSMGINEGISLFLGNVITVIVAVAIAFIVRILVNKLVINSFSKIVRKTSNKWDDILIGSKLLNRITYIIPGIVAYAFSPAFTGFQEIIIRFAKSYIAIVCILILDSLLDSFVGIYRSSKISKNRPIKGYVQTFKIILYVLGGILVVSYITNSSPWGLLSGIGAMTAVLLVIFKDTLLGLVASVQISTNDLVKIGDWIEMLKYGADGDVIDISLNTIKVQNWDKTITTIPSYALVSDSFKNWKGMAKAGGRRIKRSIFIDVKSIKFCDEEMLERFSKIQYISEYIVRKEKEIERHNIKNKVDLSQMVNGRHLTNIGTLRAYLTEYLKNNVNIHKGMTTMVRQLAPTEKGLPIEIYAFTNDTAWVNYEGIQADIFDHIFAIIPEFDLKVFQNPAGGDIHELGETLKKETFV